MLAKQPSVVEVFNDLDGRVTSLFRAIRDNGEDLAWRLQWTPYSREEYLRIRQEVRDASFIPGEDDVESLTEYGRMAATLIGQSVSGMNNLGPAGWGYGRAHNVARIWAARWPEVALYVMSRLRHVLIEHLHGMDVLERYDTPDTAFYVDPPFDPTGGRTLKRGYAVDMNERDWEVLIAVLLELKGKIILSGYAGDANRLESAGWKRADFDRTTSAGTHVAGGKKREVFHVPRIESLWLNYDVTKEGVNV